MYKRHVLKELSAYLDDQLSDKEKLAVYNHLSECKTCAEELAKLRLVSEKIKTLPEPSLKEDFDASIMSEILRQELEGGRVNMKTRPLAILVPSGVIVGILFLIVAVGMQPFIKRSYQGKPVSSGRIDKYFYSTTLNSPVSETSYWDLGDQKQLGFGKSVSRRFGGKPINGLAVDEAKVLALGGKESFRAEYDGSAFGMVRATASTPYNEPTGQETSVIVIQPILPATGQGQMIIRIGNISLEVENGQNTYQQALQISQELGGFISNSSFYKDREGREAGTITMRIPKEKFDTALDKLSKLGKVEGVNSTSQDVSQEYANLKAQLDAKIIVYNKMLDALKERKVTIPEAVRIERELAPIVSEIETLKNRIEYLNNQVAFTTVTLNFHEPEVSAKVLNETKRIIKEMLLTTSINAIKLFAKAVPVALALIFWLVVVGVAVLVIKYLFGRLFRR
ncbi:MAG: DUF4349 domain-containing protein [Candidatus Omnitrophica bacterium]|nr:DUF4349 domain-containing protein [Candidatus Omnitrophota bacterium]HOX54062.1 DUF4349 domain-containing protein [Candidatus Omnitrophota bacterium]